VNRRAFLSRLAAGVVGAVALAKLPFVADAPTRLFDGPITFRGVPLVFDQHCPRNMIYFLSPKHLWVNSGDGWAQPFGADEATMVVRGGHQ
jgi:hypothetical protein